MTTTLTIQTAFLDEPPACRPHGACMNTFDIAVYLGLIIAVATGFSTGLIRSAITILAYIVAMPIAVWVMSFVPPLTENTNSPLMQNAGFFLGAFLVIGMVLGKLARIPIDDAIGAPDLRRPARRRHARRGSRRPGRDLGRAGVRPAHSRRTVSPPSCRTRNCAPSSPRWARRAFARCRPSSRRPSTV